MANRKDFGLIGFPLGHSFSKGYFTEKFEKSGLSDTCRYSLFEIEDIHDLPGILNKNPELIGLNVTIPHKINVLPFLDEIDLAAEKIGAVNVLKISSSGKIIGFNSDYHGFKKSLIEFLDNNLDLKALILGNGGAAKAVKVALEDLNIFFKVVSRSPNQEMLSYNEANKNIKDFRLIVNTTPLGTFPNVNTSPEIDYSQITKEHFLYDLVYNPAETLFMKQGTEKGAKVINGYKMLVYQAEKSWEIWNE